MSDLSPFTSSISPLSGERARSDESVGASAPGGGVSSGSPQTAPRPAVRVVTDLQPGTVVGEYEIERKIGQGGMGSVYVAVHPVLGKRAAIKVINDDMSSDAEALARFRREARAVAQLASPYIVDVFGFGELPDGRSYYAMEHLTGESLRDRLERGRVPLDEALDLLEHIVRGLEAAHEAGIVHRDLKPENMFIERSRSNAPVVKLLDFGLVKLSVNDDGIANTQTGLMFGTPLYVSPEQIRSAGSVDHRADIYSLGCVAFELILGRVPFDRTSTVELIAAHLEVPPPVPRTLWPKIPAPLDALLLAMLAKDPAKRPTLGHVHEVIDKLRKSATSGTGWRQSIASFVDPRPAPVEAPAVNAPLVKVPASTPAGTLQPSPVLVAVRGSRHRIVILAAIGMTIVVGALIAALVAGGHKDTTATSDSVTVPVAGVDAGILVSPILLPPDTATLVTDAATSRPAAALDAAATPSQPIVTATPIDPRSTIDAGLAKIVAPPTPDAAVVAKPKTEPAAGNDAPAPVPDTSTRHQPTPPTPPTQPTKPAKPTTIDRNQTVNPFKTPQK